MKIFKHFELYEPDNKDLPSALYLRDESGLDWYECQSEFGGDSYKVAYDSEGLIVACDKDASSLFPAGLSVAEVTILPEDFSIGQCVFKDGVIQPRQYSQEELIAQAEAKKAELLSVATAAIAPLQDAVDLGEATEEETALLIEWKKYRVQVNRVDTSKPEWPETPE
ncbi:tail fiber assembly protein [Citrobacter sp. CK194]|uniref:tail fiber assembly protein n=1 Tax=Citrobacter sp. CK194 TaxID=2985103 RepID=UPI0025790344|nr:tail fiber assembly protein [Citrobacter sp. CK194]MDM3027484.1 tail fiber assembly protein [Citrobacter sp. CK194]